MGQLQTGPREGCLSASTGQRGMVGGGVMRRRWIARFSLENPKPSSILSEVTGTAVGSVQIFVLNGDFAQKKQTNKSSPSLRVPWSKKGTTVAECVQGTPPTTWGACDSPRPLLHVPKLQPHWPPSGSSDKWISFHTQDCNLFDSGLCKTGSSSSSCSELRFHFLREGFMAFGSSSSFQPVLFSSQYLFESKITLFISLLSNSLTRLETP